MSKLTFKVGVPQKIQVSFRNVGESRWIDKNDGPVGTVNFVSRILDYNSKDILVDNSRFRIPNKIEPGDHFTEEVCWFETLDSKAVLVEIKVKD